MEALIGWRVARVLACEQDRLDDSPQLLIRPIRSIGSRIRQQGPVLAESDPALSYDILDELHGAATMRLFLAEFGARPVSAMWAVVFGGIPVLMPRPYDYGYHWLVRIGLPLLPRLQRLSASSGIPRISVRRR